MNLIKQYTIKEIAERTGLSVHTLRYYENEGLIPKVERNHHGIRIYEDHVIEWLQFLRCLRDIGMPIAGMKRLVELSSVNGVTFKEQKQILQQYRQSTEDKIKDMHNFLERIDNKLAWYDDLENQNGNIGN